MAKGGNGRDSGTNTHEVRASALVTHGSKRRNIPVPKLTTIAANGWTSAVALLPPTAIHLNAALVRCPGVNGIGISEGGILNVFLVT